MDVLTMANNLDRPLPSDEPESGGHGRSDGGALAHVNGDFVARDKHVHGDEVHGDKITITEETSYTVAGLPNPYLGLHPFTYAERERYAGRAKAVTEAVAQLTTPGQERALLFITGASGSGKSSFAQAGLVPALEAHYAARGQGVRWGKFHPGERPMAMLADARQQLAAQAGDVDVLIVDQFEELFTQSPPDQRAALFAWLTSQPAFGERRQHVIATLRSDYLKELFDAKAVWDLAMANRVDLRAMTVDELKDAIQRPLQARYPEGEKRVEPALLDRLAQDASASPTLLPLLQVTLEALWKQGKLVLASYSTLTDAIKERADQVLRFADYDADSPSQPRSAEEQAAVLATLVDLVSVSLDEDPRQARVSWTLEELGTDRRALVDDLVRARLLSVAGDGKTVTVTIVHESLIANWGRLQKALQAERERLQMRARFEAALREWAAAREATREPGNGWNPADYLLKGVWLAQGQALAQAGDVALAGGAAQAFLLASAEADAAEQTRRDEEARRELEQARKLAEEQRARADEQVQARQRLRKRAFVLVGALVLAVGAAMAAVWFAMQAQNSAEESQSNELIARARQLVAESLLAGRFDLRLLLAVESLRWHETPQGKKIIHESLAGAEQGPFGVERLIYLNGDSISDLAISANRRLIVALNDGSVLLADAQTSQNPVVIDEVGHEPLVATSGGLVAITRRDTGFIKLWDVTNPEMPSALATITGSTNFGGSASAIDFSQDGNVLIAGDSESGSLQLWDVREPTAPKQIARVASGQIPFDVCFALASDASLIAVTDKRSQDVSLWDISEPHSPRLVDRLTTGAEARESGLLRNESIAISRDGQLLAVGLNDGSVELWDIRKPGQYRRIERLTHNHPARAITFSPAHDLLAIVLDESGTVILSDVSRAMQNTSQVRPESLPMPASASTVSLEFSPDGETLYLGSSSGTVSVWRRGLHDRFLANTMYTAHSDRISSLAFSVDGSRIASGASDGTIILWRNRGDFDPTQLSIPVISGWLPISDLAFLPDGKALLSLSGSKATLWAITADNQLSPSIPGEVEHWGPVTSIALSGNHGLLALGEAEDGITLWDVRDSTALRQLASIETSRNPPVTSIIFSRDGQVLTAGYDDGTVRVWNVSSAARPELIGDAVLSHNGAVRQITYWPSGDVFATAGEDESIIVWRVSDSRIEKLAVLPGSIAEFGSMEIAVSSQGNVLVAAGGNSDEGAVLWDVRNPRLPARIRTIYGVSSFSFSPDGKHLITGDNARGRSIWVWKLLGPVDFELQSDVSAPHRATLHSQVAYSADGKLLATSNAYGAVVLLEAATYRALAILGGDSRGEVNGLAFAQNGDLLGIGYESGAIEVWNTRDPSHPLLTSHLTQAPTTRLIDIEFSGSGQLLAVAREDGVVQVADLEDRSWITLTNSLQMETRGAPLWDVDLLFQPGDDALAAAVDNSILIWNLKGNSVTGHHRVSLGSPSKSITFLGRRRVLAVALDDNRIHLIDVSNPDHSRVISSLAIDGDAGLPSQGRPLIADTTGTTLFVADDRGIVHLVDLSDLELPIEFAQVGPRFAQVQYRNVAERSLAVSTDGRTLVSSSAFDIRSSTIGTDDWVSAACRVVNRDLTSIEWDRHLGQVAHRGTCSDASPRR